MKNHIGDRRSSDAVSVAKIIACGLIGTFHLLLLLVMYVKRRHNHTYFNPLYINMVVCSLLCVALSRPATILQDVVTYSPHPGYCTAYVFMLEIETVALPLALLMLLIERVLYFKNVAERQHQQQQKQEYMTRAQFWLLVSLPWLLGVVCSVVKTFVLLRPIKTPSHGLSAEEIDESRYSCHLEGRSQEAHFAGEGILYTLRSSVPLIYLLVGLTFKFFYYNKAYYVINPEENEDQRVELQRKFGENNNSGERRHDGSTNENVTSLETTKKASEPMPELEESSAKTNRTVVVMAFLALVCALVVVVSSVLVKRHGWLCATAQWLYVAMEVFIVFLPWVAFPEVFGAVCCRKSKDSDTRPRTESPTDPLTEPLRAPHTGPA